MNGPKKVCLIDKASLEILRVEVASYISITESQIESQQKDIEMYERVLEQIKESERNYANDEDAELYYGERKAHYNDLILEKTFEISRLERNKERLEKIKNTLIEKVYEGIDGFKNILESIDEGVDDYE